MADIYEYVIRARDASSEVLQKIAGKSDVAVQHLSALDRKNKDLEKSTRDFGGSISTLTRKIDVLQAERDLIHPSNKKALAYYNREIDALGRRIERLRNVGKGGFFEGLTQSLGAVTGGLGTNPFVAAGAGAFAALKGAMTIDKGMAKINLTAQLDDKGLDDLQDKLRKITRANHADMAQVPVGFESILSQVGDVEQSLPILDAAIKGAKAADVELNTVSSALAQTMSILGDRAEAIDVLDTFFASKRVGAGEFDDFARYMPNLIAGADNLGVAYKEVAGVFAYMTGKGQSAERAAVLMENMFSVLGRGEVRKKMEQVGVAVFDAEGKMRSLLDIFTDLGGVTATMTDEQRSSLLEGLGIVDKEAKNAVSVMLSDNEKLARSISEVSNSAGETERNISASQNTLLKLTEVWNTLKNVLYTVGEIALPVVSAALSVVRVVADGVLAVVSAVASVFGWWYDAIREGNPFVIVATTAIGALAVALNAAAIAAKASALWQGILTTATKVATGVTWLFNAALWANPITWIVAGVAALVAGLIALYKHFDTVRGVMLGVWEVVKELGRAIWDSLVETVRNLVGGLGSLGSALYKLFTGDFRGAWEDAKEGAKKLFMANPITTQLNIATRVSEIDFSGAYARGKAKVPVQDEKKETADKKLPSPAVPVSGGVSVPSGQLPAGAAIQAAASGATGSAGTSSGGVVDLNPIAPARMGSTAYNAIAASLRPIRVAAAGMAASMMVGSSALDASRANPDDYSPHSELSARSAAPSVVSMDKLCDTVEIHIARADGAGADEIRRVVIEALASVVDDENGAV